MSRKVLSLFANYLSEPLAYLGAIHIIIVNPPLITSVIGWVDIDTLHLPRVIGQQGFQGFEVVALDQQVPRLGVARRQLRVAMDEPIGHLAMMVLHRALADPVQRGHRSPSPCPAFLGRVC